jgi:hypothetical protein
VKDDVTMSIDRDAEPILVNRTMMPAAQQNQVVETRRPSVRPVLHVMGVAEPQAAPGKPATSVALLDSVPDRGRNRPRS